MLLARLANCLGVIYNVMSGIHYIVGEDPAKARGVIRDFSIYLGKVFRSVTGREPVPFTEEPEHTKIIVEYDGEDFMPSLNVEEDAVGLPNVRSRLKRVCDGELIVARREDGGTVVPIRIPESKWFFTERWGIPTPSVSAARCHLPLRGRLDGRLLSRGTDQQGQL